MREADLDAARRRFQEDPSARAAFLGGLGVSAAEQAAFKVSLFCYPHAPVAALFDALQGHPAPVLCLVPDGVAPDAVAGFLGSPAVPGATCTRGSLTVRVLPFLEQTAYDKLLWACDLNFVRGEDSIVRAQWAGRPFVWHIYPQDENLHHVKLRAFLQRFSPHIDAANAFNLGWNHALPAQPPMSASWTAYAAALADSAARTEQWQAEMAGHGDLASNLLRFAETVRAANRSAP